MHCNIFSSIHDHQWLTCNFIDIPNDVVKHIRRPTHPIYSFQRIVSYNNSIFVNLIMNPPEGCEKASFLKLILLMKKKFRVLPNFNILYLSSDANPIRGFTKIPVFTNSYSNNSNSIAVPDFTFVGWNTQAEPWCDTLKMTPTPWYKKKNAIFFSGDGRRSPERRQLFHMKSNVQGIPIIARDTSLNTVKHVSLQEVCKYRFLLSLPGAGYSSRLKNLLLCGSVVIHLAHESEEFFTPWLKNGIHYIRIKRIEDLKSIASKLHNNENNMKIAVQSRNFILEHLSWNKTLLYLYNKISKHSREYTFSQHRNFRNFPRNMSKIETMRDIDTLVNQKCRKWDCATAYASCFYE